MPVNFGKIRGSTICGKRSLFLQLTTDICLHFQYPSTLLSIHLDLPPTDILYVSGRHANTQVGVYCVTCMFVRALC